MFSFSRAYFTYNPKGKPEINKVEAFVGLLNGILPIRERSFQDIFNEFDKEIIRLESSVTSGALSNTHGD